MFFIRVNIRNQPIKAANVNAALNETLAAEMRRREARYRCGVFWGVKIISCQCAKLSI